MTLVVVASSHAQQFDPVDYTAIDLGGVLNQAGNSTGGTNFWAYSLTDSGQVSGYGMQLAVGYAPNEVLGSWNATSGFVTGLTTPMTGGNPNSPYVSNYVPVAGNNAGTIVWTDSTGAGHIWNSSTGDTQPSAFAAAGATYSALWINNNGLVVGGADPAGGNGPGIVYDSVAQKTVTSTLPGVAYFINDAGQAGGAENNFGSGFVWSQTASNGWAQGVTTLSNMCEVFGISQNGQYAVGEDTTFTNGVLYNNVTQGYTTVAPGTAISVNNSGWVGGSSSTGNYANITPTPSAWLWDGTTLYTGAQLTAMLPAGYTAVSVMAVNDSDQILVWGDDDGDNWNSVQSFLLTPNDLLAPHPGDANQDGRVDINDLTIVLTNFGQTGLGWTQGCMDGDPTGTVDINDLTIVLSNFGWTAGNPAGPATVPEPGGLALLALGLIGLAAARKTVATRKG